MRSGSPKKREPAPEQEAPRKPIWEAFRNTPRAFGLVWGCSRVATVAMALLTLLGGLLPAAQAYTAKLIVDTVVGSLAQGFSPADGLTGALPYIGLEFGLLLVNSILTQGR